MIRAVRVHGYGGPEALIWEELPRPSPGQHEVLIRQEAVGLNFIDVYYRTGFYKLPTLPSVIGMEAAGVVEAVGAAVGRWKPGDRVAYPSQLGAYASHRTIAEDLVVRLPDAIDASTAAAIMLRGLTAQALLRQVHRLEAGQTILVHAAAGGVGLLLCQWAAHLGATVIGVVSTERKAELARRHGAAHVIVGIADLPARVKQITGGALLPVVYDSVGRDSFVASLDCLAPRGLMVSYGNASGEVTDLALSQLSQRGSLYVTRPKLMNFIAKQAAKEQAVAELFEALISGAVRAEIGQSYPLSQVSDAHRALEARETTGSTVLIPD